MKLSNIFSNINFTQIYIYEIQMFVDIKIKFILNKITQIQHKPK